MEAVDRQGILPLVFARQLPGVRTLVSAACGAADVPYRRFLTAGVLGASIWSMVWAGGGAIFGRLIIAWLGPVLPWLILGWVVALVCYVVYKRVKSRRREKIRTATK